jgi:methionyl-tRNA synthetase
LHQIDLLNRLIEDTKPWELARTDDPKLDAILATLAQNCVVIAWLLAPFLPETAEKIAANFGTSIAAINYDTLTSEPHTVGRKVAPTDPLFPRLLS